MMKIHLGFFLGFAAICLAVCAAFFSIYGLSQLFAGAALSVIIMASVLEMSKLIIASYLHNYWATITKIMKIYLTSGVVILALITSAGIYGYLSNAYQMTANNLELHDGKIEVIQSKIDYFKKSVDGNQKLIDSKTNRLNQLVDIRTKQESRLDVEGGNSRTNKRMISTTSSELNLLNSEIDKLNTLNSSLNDSIGKYTTNKIETNSNNSVAGEVGPLKYMAKITGMSMDKIVNIFILLLIFVFDPLAICLVIATNSVFLKNQKKNVESEETIPEIEEKIRPEVNKDVIPTTQPSIESKISMKDTNIESSINKHSKVRFEDIKEIKEMNNLQRNFSKNIPTNNKHIER